jgi:nucleoside-diphosphate kinase
MAENLQQTVNKHLERCLVLVKPDGVRRGLSGEILRRLEVTGLKVVALKMIKVDRNFAEKHYTYEDIAVRHGEAIRNQLLEYITEGPVIAAVFEGVACVATIRKICGKTEPSSSPAGTIRGDFCHQNYEFCNDVGQSIRNLVHASATVEEAKNEVSLWFGEQDFYSYRRSDQEEHLYA